MSPMQVEIQEKVKQQFVNPVPVVKEAVKSQGFLNKFLGSCIVILTMATIGMIIYRNYNKEYTVTSYPREIREERPSTQRPIIVPPLPDRSGMSELNQRIDKLEVMMKEWTRRIWLLSLAHNENVNMARQHGACAPNYYIFFEPDWKLNRFPNSLQVPEELRGELQKDVK